ncbi:hypothetical protein Cob_v004752 [Colletotrichum orbiculare MAFF 240422]|uniref:Uncharacterized protein n=1 Tax=Colletotrichum orbiculare (strain 104-T / ATCC 96160 / CBS 514.97 / LARS 414 / MAFF 240422) TaxID=1213857 RepID=A0A484FVH8_COLOR|nr:hypothetical protein Cob_v004752 [Colletotrichum orbiculare MAFF 240422]
MHSTIIFAVLAAAASLTAAAPANSDPTICAPGTGFFQTCSNGFRGCCKADACTIGYCPTDTAETHPEQTPVDCGSAAATAAETKTHSKRATSDPTVCAPGTGFFQTCANGFSGCCKGDACSTHDGTCPPVAAKRDPTVCAPGTGFFQSCDQGNGFVGCCNKDACGLGYCPDVENTDTAAPETVKRDPTVCAPGTGFFQSCNQGSGFVGCCKQDACGLGYCPDVEATTENTKRDPTVCAPGTGFFQSCNQGKGFVGCCTKDACGLGYCPDVRAFETVVKTLSKAAATPTPAPEVSHQSRTTDPTVCAPGTGFFQSCSNGFRGCCKEDACTIGFCPSN